MKFTARSDDQGLFQRCLNANDILQIVMREQAALKMVQTG